MSSQYRAAAVADMSASPRRKPNISMGIRRYIMRVSAATVCPSVIQPPTTPHAPTIAKPTIASCGRTMTAPNSQASSRTFVISWSRNRSTIARKRAVAHGLRPNARSTRMPCTDSSTDVDTSPMTSCAAREAILYRELNHATPTIVGSAMTSRITTNTGWMNASMSAPIVMRNGVMTMKGRPNAAKRRSMLRSFVARDSICPESHASWCATSSRCRCANSRRRHSTSHSAVIAAVIVRRISCDAASTSPTAATAATSSASPLRSRCAMGPSTAAPVRTGTKKPTPVETSASRMLTT